MKYDEVKYVLVEVVFVVLIKVGEVEVSVG